MVRPHSYRGLAAFVSLSMAASVGNNQVILMCQIGKRLKSLKRNGKTWANLGQIRKGISVKREGRRILIY
jgi:hypothetical protein